MDAVILAIPAFIILATIAVGTVCGIVHSIFDIPTTLRHIFMPRTKQEFWFPPCPLCWAARGAVVVGAVLLTVQLVP